MIQKTRCIVGNIYYMRIIIVFVKSKEVLLKKILEDSDFISLNLVVVSNKKEIIYIIILYFYKLYTQIYQKNN